MSHQNIQIEFLFYSRTLDVPVIGALRGPAIGAGACLAIAGCDLRVAERSTKMAFNFLKIGLHPGEYFYYVSFVSLLNELLKVRVIFITCSWILQYMYFVVFIAFIASKTLYFKAFVLYTCFNSLSP